MNKLFKAVTLIALICALMTGCVTYTIDSNPQGLRVTIDDLERGVTPCEYTTSYGDSISIEVAPPTYQQCRQYEQKNNVKIINKENRSQTKRVDSFDGSGTVFFQFINEEIPAESAAEEEKESKPEFDESPLLNEYNTYIDNFAGELEVGKIYYNYNEIDKRLHFRVIQILSDDTILVRRNYERDWIGGEIEDFCDSVTFIVRAKQPYADGATLREGAYRCTGTQTYETKGGDTKTVYVFEEVEQSQEEEP